LTKPVHWAAVAAALISASCAGPPTETGPGAPKPSASNLQEVATTAPRKRPQQGAVPAPPISPPRARITSAALMGLADNALAQIMGAPGFKRVDDPAALWQYRGASCILDVFLYADGPVYRVAHLEFRQAGAGGGPMDGKAAENCFSGLFPGAGGKG